jgi:hypothetical protein
VVSVPCVYLALSCISKLTRSVFLLGCQGQKVRRWKTGSMTCAGQEPYAVSWHAAFGEYFARAALCLVQSQYTPSFPMCRFTTLLYLESSPMVAVQPTTGHRPPRKVAHSRTGNHAPLPHILKHVHVGTWQAMVCVDEASQNIHMGSWLKVSECAMHHKWSVGQESTLWTY